MLSAKAKVWQGSAESQKFFLALIMASINDPFPVIAKVGEHQIANLFSEFWNSEMVVDNLLYCLA